MRYLLNTNSAYATSRKEILSEYFYRKLGKMIQKWHLSPKIFYSLELLASKNGLYELAVAFCYVDLDKSILY